MFAIRILRRTARISSAEKSRWTREKNLLKWDGALTDRLWSRIMARKQTVWILLKFLCNIESVLVHFIYSSLSVPPLSPFPLSQTHSRAPLFSSPSLSVSLYLSFVRSLSLSLHSTAMEVLLLFLLSHNYSASLCYNTLRFHLARNKLVQIHTCMCVVSIKVYVLYSHTVEHSVLLS